MSDAVQRFRQLFRGLDRAHGQMMSPSAASGGKKKPWVVHTIAPDAAWTRHLTGEEPALGIVPILDAGACYFGAGDVDDHSLGDVGCGRLQARCDELKLPLVVCRSTRGGAHLYRFLQEPIPAEQLIAELRAAVRALKIPGNPEIFPKQTQLLRADQKPPKPDGTPNEDDVGNWIALPYFGGDATARYAVGADGKALTFAAFLDRAEAARLLPWPELADPTAVWGDDFASGPTCMRDLHARGVPEGYRNDMVFNVGAYAKDLGRDDWQDQLEGYNERCLTAALDEKEIKAIVRGVKKKDYSIKCLGAGRKCPTPRACKFKQRLAHAGGPEFKKLVKIDSDPPTWELHVDDARIRVEDTRLLQSPPSVERLVIDALNKTLPSAVKSAWPAILKSLLEDVTVEAAPEDAGEAGRLAALVKLYLLLHYKTDGWQDTLRGLPFRDPGTDRIYFLSQSLVAFLESRKWWVGKSAAPLHQQLRELGCGYDEKQRSVCGAKVRFWYFDAKFLEGEQTEPFAHPEPKLSIV
ncbi:MAG: TOTE conflict system archaeo-eukaryotic primase domain-containing protein [Gemmatimonadales bacterium]